MVSLSWLPFFYGFANGLAGRDLHPQDIAAFAQRTLKIIDTFRFGVLEIWLASALLFFSVVLTDAYLQRRIRQNQFAYASPLVHYYTWLFVSMTVMGLVLAPMLPFTLSPLNLPLGLGVCALASWIGLAFTQKRV